jgi:hypothetical protein
MSGIITKIEGRWFIANRFGECILVGVINNSSHPTEARIKFPDSDYQTKIINTHECFCVDVPSWYHHSVINVSFKVDNKWHEMDYDVGKYEASYY